MAKDTKKKRKGNAGAEGEKYAICLEGVNKAYEDGVPALTDINLKIVPGEFVFILKTINNHVVTFKS